MIKPLPIIFLLILVPLAESELPIIVIDWLDA